MNITLTGASGFIGAALIAKLKADGHHLHVLGRNPPKDASLEFSKWDASGKDLPPAQAIAGAEAIIHLAGEPIAQRWTDEVKKKLRTSRVNGTQKLVEAISGASSKPRVLVSGSAIGYYGDRGNEIINEGSKPGKGFLPDMCVDWENAALEAGKHGLRVALLRTGIVLGEGGGAMAQLLPFFKMGTGGKIASGNQWMSWIHLDDMVGLILFALNNEKVSGPLNGTAPNPVTNADFTHILGEVIHRPAVFPIPEFGLKLLYGEMAQVLIEGARVVPEAAMQAGYHFQYPELRAAFASVT